MCQSLTAFYPQPKMEQDPTKLGTMKLMGTFGVPSYISFGDEYMKKIRAWLAHPRATVDNTV